MTSGGGHRKRDRSRSPFSASSVGYRRNGNKEKDNLANINNMGMGNMPIMMNNMYQQGNMMMPNVMAGGMYPNMMMQGSMMGGGMIAPTDMVPGPGMDMITQQPMDMASIGSSSNTPTGSMDMNIMAGMMMDPSIMGMGNMGMFPTMTGELPIERKEIILKHCKLTPGNTDPPQRSRPLGCRTIFVGGWPENVRESLVREIFEPYGRIHTLRLSKKNFCHIRFDRETSVDAAMALSGYKVKLIDAEKGGKEEEEDNAKNSGWLHVDYALSRDDQNEYERRQRQALRIQQQQMQALSAQQEMMGGVNMVDMNDKEQLPRSPSPRIQPFSQSSIVQLMEGIKNEENFPTTLPTLLAWLERGECSKKNSNQFYSMIQATNSHIRRLYNEKMQSEEELNACKERVKDNIARVIDLLEQVAKVFTAATHQRVWDHFTKPQRKNIESWQKMTQEFNILREEFNEKFNNEEKEDCGNHMTSDSGSNYNNRLSGSGADNRDLQTIKMENDSLRFQLEAYKNEIDVIKKDAMAELEKFKAQFIARQALQGAFDNNPPLPSSAIKPPPPPPPLPGEAARVRQPVESGCGEARLIGVMSAFLQVHPQGASLDYVESYVRGLFPTASQATVHHVLQKHSDVFECTTSGVGANIEHKWNFVAFNSREGVK